MATDENDFEFPVTGEKAGFINLHEVMTMAMDAGFERPEAFQLVSHIYQHSVAMRFERWKRGEIAGSGDDLGHE